jgi:hypothetical protein
LAQFSVTGGVLNGAMAEPVLDCPRVVALVSKRVAAGVPQHMDVNLEWKTGALADALDQAIDGIGGKRGAALCLENLLEFLTGRERN